MGSVSQEDELADMIDRVRSWTSAHRCGLYTMGDEKVTEKGISVLGAKMIKRSILLQAGKRFQRTSLLS